MDRLLRISALLVRALLIWLGRKRLPQISGSLKVGGLLSPVEIARDRWGVPHIYAANLHDLFFAQGFVHAQDRFWQMELNRRAAAGRLSELLGPACLETDRAARTLGFHRLAEEAWSRAGSGLQEMVSAYTEGINAYLGSDAARRPLEFALLCHHPEPWQPQDTMAILQLTAWQFNFGWIGKLLRAGICERIGMEGLARVDAHYPPGFPLTLPHGIELNGTSLSRKGSPYGVQGIGSNAWALSGEKTTSGKPSLCNDPHVPPTLPSLWYEVHLVGDRLNVIGASMPGMPTVTIGHNARIAWGFTMAMTDTDDLYVEEFHPQEPGRYRFQGEWLAAEVIDETIRIRGRPKPHIERVLLTCHGPIISGIVGSSSQPLALRSVALQPLHSLWGWFLLNCASNWEEFTEALRHIEAPSLNVLYADVEGNIGYRLTGKIPLRAKGQGIFPVPGWDGEYEWIGEIPFDEMPQALNPKQGYILNCNNRIVPDDYPHFLGNLWSNGYRACRLRDLLEEKERLSLADLASMQRDLLSIPGQAFMENLRSLSNEDPDVRLALSILRAWDGRLDAESVGGTLYQIAKYILLRDLLDPRLGKELTSQLMGHGHDSTLLLRLLDEQGAAWLAEMGGYEAVLVRGLKQAVRWLRQELGSNPSNWRWGRLHPLTFSHALGRHPFWAQVFNLGPYSLGGDADTLCQTAASPSKPFAHEVAPTYRQIVDLGDLRRSLSIHVPGQSGHLGSPHYGDLTEMWLRGEYHPMLWERADIERETESALHLIP